MESLSKQLKLFYVLIDPCRRISTALGATIAKTYCAIAVHIRSVENLSLLSQRS